jgi:hypothetical protein
MLKPLLATSCMLVAAGSARADEITASSTTTASTRVGIEIGPEDLALGGYGLGAAITPAGSHWRFGSTAYRLELPKFVTELDSANKGWTATLTFGIDANVSYQLDASGKGWFFEGVVPYERYDYSIDGMTAHGADVSVVAGAGYKWMPYRGLYIRPLLAVALRVASTGSRTVDGKEFADPVAKPLPILHVGYEF